MSNLVLTAWCEKIASRAPQDGAEALEMLMFAQPGYYSLILMDLRMPVMDGFAATKAVSNFGDLIQNECESSR